MEERKLKKGSWDYAFKQNQKNQHRHLFAFSLAEHAVDNKRCPNLPGV
jgi:hypothetical protein